MEEKNNWCVYVHIFPNGKKYVGITGVGVEKRWGYKGRGYIGQIVYNAINKYGWDNIKHKILKENITEQQAKELEKFYINKFDSFNNGYNFTKGGEGTVGVIYTESRRKKISNALKGRKISELCIEKNKQKRKPVYQIDMYTQKIINRFDSAQDACEKLNLKEKSGIINCANGRNKTSYKYIWRYVDNYDPNEEYNLKHTQTNRIHMISVDDNSIINTYNSFAEAERKTKIKATNIYEACKTNGRQNTAGGFIWRYADKVENNISEEVVNE